MFSALSRQLRKRRSGRKKKRVERWEAILFSPFFTRRFHIGFKMMTDLVQWASRQRSEAYFGFFMMWGWRRNGPRVVIAYGYRCLSMTWGKHSSVLTRQLFAFSLGPPPPSQKWVANSGGKFGVGRVVPKQFAPHRTRDVATPRFQCRDFQCSMTLDLANPSPLPSALKMNVVFRPYAVETRSETVFSEHLRTNWVTQRFQLPGLCSTWELSRVLGVNNPQTLDPRIIPDAANCLCLITMSEIVGEKKKHALNRGTVQFFVKREVPCFPVVSHL